MMIKKFYVAVAALLALLAVSTAQADVTRAILTTGIVEREPVNELNAIPADAQRAIFFTEIRDMAGKTVSHVWKHNGEVMAEVKFNVGGPRWRVWSSKNMVSDWAGDWSVTVTDDEGNQLAEKTFTYEAAAMTDGGMAKETAPAEAASAEDSGDAMPAEEAAPAAPMESEKPAEAPAAEPMKEGE